MFPFLIVLDSRPVLLRNADQAAVHGVSSELFHAGLTGSHAALGELSDLDIVPPTREHCSVWPELNQIWLEADDWHEGVLSGGFLFGDQVVPCRKSDRDGLASVKAGFDLLIGMGRDPLTLSTTFELSNGNFLTLDHPTLLHLSARMVGFVSASFGEKQQKIDLALAGL